MTDVRQFFPDALPVPEFVERLTRVADGLGTHPGNALPAIGVCRDELCFSFCDSLEHVWGSAFQLGSLAGMAFLGRTGLSAAAHHAPLGHSSRRYLAVALTHLGIGDDGTLGVIRRPGQGIDSPACGALIALRNEIAAGEPEPEISPDDLEQGLLRTRLRHLRPLGKELDIMTTTLAARDAIRDDVLGIGTSLDLEDPAKVILATGVLLHTTVGDWVGGYSVLRVFRDGDHELVEL